MRSIREVNLLLGDRLADDGQPGIQLIRNTWLSNTGLGDQRDSGRYHDMSVGVPLWVGRYSPSLGLEGWPSGGSASRSIVRMWETATRRTLIQDLLLTGQPQTSHAH